MTEVAVGSEPTDGTGSGGEADRRLFDYVSDLEPAVRRFGRSGALSGVGGVVTLARGLQALRRGETGRGLVRLVLGGLFVALAVAQRRSSDREEGRDAGDVDQRDVAGSGVDIEDVSTGLDDDERAGDTDPSEVVDTAPDLDDVETDRDGTAGSSAARGDLDGSDVVSTGVDEESLREANETGGEPAAPGGSHGDDAEATSADATGGTDLDADATGADADAAEETEGDADAGAEGTDPEGADADEGTDDEDDDSPRETAADGGGR